MAQVIDSGLFRYVSESAVSEVLKKYIARSYGGDKQVLVAIIVDVRKRGTHIDPITKPYPRVLGDILKTAASQVVPKFVATKLVDKIDVIETISVHVRHGEPTTMVIVDRLIKPPGVIHDRVPKNDSTFRQFIGELEVVNHLVC